MLLLDGKAVAKAVRERLKAQVADWSKKTRRAPGLSVILVGEDPASQVYVRNKMKACAEVGMISSEVRLSTHTKMEELKEQIELLNHDPAVDGILLQLPLPKGLDGSGAIEWILPEKDADCLTVTNQGRLWAGAPLTTPCTPSGVMEILRHYEIPVAGRNAVVIGRSAIVGRPMAHLLTQADATVTICHSKTKDLRRFTREADIVVVAAGRPELLGKDDFGPDCVVVDVGIHRKNEGGLCGDVRFAELKDHVRALTPVPGGVGPMTIAMLLQNTMTLADHHFA
ncbi:MAG: bifunctional methylenetetrahydrofolate dehydrogenase/methenyltetrahydrofolate cyclohydrolase FolD [Bdellovibrionales bacterium]